MNKSKLNLYWSRRDFRTHDNPALYNSVQKSLEEKTEFASIFVLDKGLLEDNNWNIGFSRRKYLSILLDNFQKIIPNFEVVVGNPEEVFTNLSNQYQLNLFVNDDCEPYSIQRDKKIQKIIEGSDGKLHSYSDQISVPANITTKSSGNLYSVFTPFKNAVLENFLSTKVYPKPNLHDIKKINWKQKLDEVNLKTIDNSSSLGDEIYKLIEKPNNLYLNETTINLDELIEQPKVDLWYKSEQQALEYFDYFNTYLIRNYKQNRDDLALDTKFINGKAARKWQERGFSDFLLSGATSKMSTALKWGLVSARELKERIADKHGDDRTMLKMDQKYAKPYHSDGITHYLFELVWREFYRYIILHNPQVLDTEYQEKFRNTIDWVDGNTAINRMKEWIRGNTGYELVDACMNQISQTGWMHNRGRMMTASILTKNLGIDWRWGQEYFRSMLIDLDEASNNGGWQWAASVGADPKPIRIFNPHIQNKKYDTNNAYKDKWLPKKYDRIMQSPIIEHKLAREQALKRYKLAKDTNARDY